MTTERKPVFVNEAKPTRAHYAQISRCQMFRSPIEFYALLGALVVLIALTVISNTIAGQPPVSGGNAVLFGALIALLILLCGAWFVLPALQAGKAASVTDAAITITTSLYDDEVRTYSSSTKKTAVFRYSDFSRVLETPDLYLLCTSAKQTIMLDKNSFTDGDAKDFPAFAKQKFAAAKVALK